MATRTHTPDVIKPVTGDLDKHPRGLYVLFATEMWERFGFYTIGGMFALYLRDEKEGVAFWIVLSGLALVMAIVLLTLLRPLKKAMPGV
jgi:POT family proton-dependent oligopeptide transporter